MDPAIAVINSINHLVTLDTGALGIAAALAVGWTTIWVGLWLRAIVIRFANRTLFFN